MRKSIQGIIGASTFPPSQLPYPSPSLIALAMSVCKANSKLRADSFLSLGIFDLQLKCSNSVSERWGRKTRK